MCRANKFKLLISAAVLLIAAGWVVRISPFLDSSAVRGVFFANNFYGMVFVAENGHLLKPELIDTQGQVGNNVLSSVADPSRSAMGGIIAMVLGFDDTPRQIAYILTRIPYQGVFLFPAVAFLLLRSGTYVSDKRAYFIVLLFGLFGSYEIIYATNSGSGNAGVGWSLFIIGLWAIYRSHESRGRLRYHLILLTVFVAIVTWYHTMGIIFLFVILLFAGTEAILYDDSNFALYLAYPIIAFLHYSNVARTYFIGYVRNFAVIASEVANLNFGSGAVYYQYQVAAETNIISRVSSLLGKGLVGLMFATYGILALRYTLLRRRTDQSEWLPLQYLSSMPIVFGVIFMGYGLVLGLFRTLQYAILVLPLAIVISARRYLPKIGISPQRTFTIMVLVMALVATTSTTAYLTTPTRESGLIQHNEYTSAQWFDSHAPEDAVVFTDYRLSPPFLVQSRFGVSAIWPREAAPTDRKFAEIYYSNSGDEAGQAISNQTVSGEAPDYILVSERMTESNIGINANGRRFRAMTPEEYEKFDKTTRFLRVYNSGEAVIYDVGD